LSKYNIEKFNIGVPTTYPCHTYHKNQSHACDDFRGYDTDKLYHSVDSPDKCCNDNPPQIEYSCKMFEWQQGQEGQGGYVACDSEGYDPNKYNASYTKQEAYNCCNDPMILSSDNREDASTSCQQLRDEPHNFQCPSGTTDTENTGVYPYQYNDNCCQSDCTSLSTEGSCSSNSDCKWNVNTCIFDNTDELDENCTLKGIALLFLKCYKNDKPFDPTDDVNCCDQAKYQREEDSSLVQVKLTKCLGTENTSGYLPGFQGLNDIAYSGDPSYNCCIDLLTDLLKMNYGEVAFTAHLADTTEVENPFGPTIGENQVLEAGREYVAVTTATIDEAAHKAISALSNFLPLLNHLQKCRNNPNAKKIITCMIKYMCFISPAQEGQEGGTYKDNSIYNVWTDDSKWNMFVSQYMRLLKGAGDTYNMFHYYVGWMLKILDYARIVVDLITKLRGIGAVVEAILAIGGLLITVGEGLIVIIVIVVAVTVIETLVNLVDDAIPLIEDGLDITEKNLEALLQELDQQLDNIKTNLGDPDDHDTITSTISDPDQAAIDNQENALLSQCSKVDAECVTNGPCSALSIAEISHDCQEGALTTCTPECQGRFEAYYKNCEPVIDRLTGSELSRPNFDITEAAAADIRDKLQNISNICGPNYNFQPQQPEPQQPQMCEEQSWGMGNPRGQVWKGPGYSQWVDVGSDSSTGDADNCICLQGSEKVQRQVVRSGSQVVQVRCEPSADPSHHASPPSQPDNVECSDNEDCSQGYECEGGYCESG
jgi:hypothetical protein